MLSSIAELATKDSANRGVTGCANASLQRKNLAACADILVRIVEKRRQLVGRLLVIASACHGESEGFGDALGGSRHVRQRNGQTHPARRPCGPR